jgi:hypothetical protein
MFALLLNTKFQNQENKQRNNQSLEQNSTDSTGQPRPSSYIPQGGPLPNYYPFDSVCIGVI